MMLSLEMKTKKPGSGPPKDKGELGMDTLLFETA
jgi:hypothetical protein